MERFTALIGFFAILAFAWALSTDRRAIRWRIVFWGLVLQIVVAILVLKGTQISAAFGAFKPPLEDYGAALIFIGLAIVIYWLVRLIGDSVKKPLWIAFAVVSAYLFLAFNLLAYMFQSMKHVITGLIGYTQVGSEFVFGKLGVQNGDLGFIFATQVLPTIIFIASIFAVLYYLGVMQLVVTFFAKLMTRFMGASGAESTSVAASIFMGQTEAPLTIRPFL
ncbi:MAG TPA: Na+ dependent nucleoside transporter N-terminal domain-containing protein, partial [Thermoanaerobaculia bacterium]|nr:Na+ dependent nucleoside transporter N-terminal domain-containing protein [Thermoanaerobaculia bacterium]